MLNLLFILSAISFILLFVLTFLKKKNGGTLYNVLGLVQGGCIGAIFGILAVMFFKGSGLG